MGWEQFQVGSQNWLNACPRDPRPARSMDNIPLIWKPHLWCILYFEQRKNRTWNILVDRMGRSHSYHSEARCAHLACQETAIPTSISLHGCISLSVHFSFPPPFLWTSFPLTQGDYGHRSRQEPFVEWKIQQNSVWIFNGSCIPFLRCDCTQQGFFGKLAHSLYHLRPSEAGE